MDKIYSSPGDVGNASAEDVARALNRVLRRIEGKTQFIYQAGFGFANGRKGPLLMVGALRGAWREYIRRHASSPEFAAGECEVRKDDSGKLILEHRATRGKGTNPSHERTLNSGPLRRMGAEARFVTASAAGAPAAPIVAETSAIEGADKSTDAIPEEDHRNADIDALGKSILVRFGEFKSGPTMDILSDLTSQILQFNALRDSGVATETQITQQIEKIAKLVETKGRAYVDQKRRAGEG